MPNTLPQSNNTLFLPYQKRWIQDNSRIKLMEKSRQIGISWTSAYNLVRKQGLIDAPYDAWVSSRDEVQARLFLEDCRLFAESLNLASKAIGSPILEDNARSNAYTLTLLNKRRIHSLTSNPDAQAGKRGTRILDEFALHPDPHKLYSIALPGLTWGGSLEIISTHRGRHNFFYELIQEARYHGNPKQISLHRVTLEDALNQGFLERLKTKLPADDPRQLMDNSDYFDWIRQSCADEEIFQQEYMCEPADDTSAFLPIDLITPCEYTPHEPWAINLNGPFQKQTTYFLGVDIGRDHDLTVFWLLEAHSNMLFTRSLTCLQNTPFIEQAAVLADYMQIPGLTRVCMDQTGIGRALTEEAIRLYGPYRIEGITFTAGIKESLVYPVRAAFENKTLRIPADPHLRADLRSIKKEVTSAGNLRFGSERVKSGHADRFWALALAIHAAKNPTPLSPQYETIHRPKRGTYPHFICTTI